jgi:hypothetical protein
LSHVARGRSRGAGCRAVTPWKNAVALGIAAALSNVGCRCSSEPVDDVPTVNAAARAPHCVRDDVQLTLEPSLGSQPVEAPLDPDIEQPFASEPGMALAFGREFFATGLRHESRGAVALLGRLVPGDAATQLIELGQVRGDVLAPRLAADDESLWVVVQEGTPRGRELRVGHYPAGNIGLPAIWRQGPEQGSAESSAFDIAAREGGALLVYDEWSPIENHGRVLAASLQAAAAEGPRLEGQPISPAGSDAETPRVAARPGGYWVAWLVNASTGGSGRTYDPANEQDERAGAGAAYGARWLSIAAVDASGKLSGEVRRVTNRRERVLGFDLATSPSGSAWLAWRQDAPTPGASGGRVYIGEIGGDASREPRLVREDDVGSGEPAWLAARGDEARWLTFPDGRDRSLLMRVGSLQAITAPLKLGSDLEGAGALAASAGKVLFALPRGRSVVLLSAACAPAGAASQVDGGVLDAPRAFDGGLPAVAPAAH